MRPLKVMQGKLTEPGEIALQMEASSSIVLASLQVIFAILFMWALVASASVVGGPASAVIFGFWSLSICIISPRLSIVWLFVTPIFLNLLIAISKIPQEYFNVVRSFPFIFLCTFVIVNYKGCIARVRELGSLFPTLMLSWVFLCVLFSLYGLASGRGVASVIYFRNCVSPTLYLMAGLVVGQRYGLLVRSLAIACGYFLAVWAIIEFFYTLDLYNAIDISTYINGKGNINGYFFRTSEDFIFNNSRDFFNHRFFADWGKMSRLLGPNLHIISFGYILSTLAIVALLTGRKILLFLLCFAVIATGAKGPLILLAGAFLGVGIRALLGSNRNRDIKVYSVLVVAWVALAVALGLANRDYHVVGLMGGLRGFISLPIGHGIGAGGVLTGERNALDTDKWQTFQNEGASYGLESAFGVGVYQMGVFFLLIYVIFLIFSKSFLSVCTRPERVFIYALLAACANSVLQEEALFAPLAMPFLLFLAASWVGRRFSVGNDIVIKNEDMRSSTRMSTSVIS